MGKYTSGAESPKRIEEALRYTAELKSKLPPEVGSIRTEETALGVRTGKVISVNKGFYSVRFEYKTGGSFVEGFKV